jgi:hypothetical protein
MATRHENPIKKTLLRCVENLLDISEGSERVEFTIKVDKKAIPTISYKVDNCQILQRLDHRDEYFDELKEKYTEGKT